MTSRIRFEEPKIADPKEMERYENVMMATWPNGKVIGQVGIGVNGHFDADKDGREEMCSCIGLQPFEPKQGRKEPGWIGCSVYREGSVELGHEEWKSEKYRFSERTIRDLRFGDIDRDGDIDVAFKMSDGAIYVYHNVTPSHTAPR